MPDHGARTAGGCTSGHGVCGIARLSMRSIVAVLMLLPLACFLAGYWLIIARIDASNAFGDGSLLRLIAAFSAQALRKRHMRKTR